MEKLTLDYPIEIDSQQVLELEMRRPTVGDYLAMDKMSGSDAEKELKLMASLCQQSPDDLMNLDMGDYLKLQEKLKSFSS
ncbi:MAG: phage tail assembly protein [Lentisphaerae bacterium]|nr:phage tail assembly protein [Lentisphaerota bacterium]MCP4102898.1 phage tail assembly protein [Lentisphaerota bacterium]